MHSNAKIMRHESYGALQISRCQCSSTALFGSSIKHDHTIRMRISAAEMKRNLHTDWLHPSSKTADIYVEVEMSYSQFAEAITSLNQGEGVPVTVRYANGRKMEQCPFTSKDDQFRAEFEADLLGLASNISRAEARIKELFDNKKPMNKVEKDEFLSLIREISTEISSNLPFLRDCFVEQMEKTVTEAKGNFEGFIQSRMNNLANEALANNIASMDGSVALLGLGDVAAVGEEADSE